ncbi:putative serine proteinase inhibitor [Trichonephila clavipes]|nr:putative serine proteinase inhibitor [Trichonephila clavipes]
MMFLILFALVAGALAFPECPANSHYESCGTACPLTCDNYINPPKVCVLRCDPGCHCDEGYVKTEEGSCVLPEECSSQPKVEFSSVTCAQDKKVGPCKAAFPRYFYNKHTHECEEFIYGGCLGNDNNFNSREDCEAVCILNMCKNLRL